MTFLILTSIPIQSGTGIRISNIARSLAENGHPVTMTGIGPRPQELGPVRYVKIHDLGNRALTFLLSLAVNLCTALAKTPDVLFCSKTLPNAVLPAFFPVSKKRIKVLDLDDLEYGYWAGTWKEPVLRWMDRVMVMPFDRIAVHTRELEEYAVLRLHAQAKKMITLKQGVRVSRFGEGDETLKARLGLEGKRIILYTAHLGIASRGGLEFIFQGCRGLLRKREDLRLLIVGSGDRMGHYKKLAAEMGLQDKALFAGEVPYGDMPRYFAAADISVNYLEDTEANRCRSSVKVRESLAAGIPVVCNRVGSDLARFTPYLYAYNTDDADGFTKRLEDALADVRARRVEEGRRFIKKEWDWERVIHDFLRDLKANEQQTKISV